MWAKFKMCYFSFYVDCLDIYLSTDLHRHARLQTLPVLFWSKRVNIFKEEKNSGLQKPVKNSPLSIFTSIYLTHSLCS